MMAWMASVQRLQYILFTVYRVDGRGRLMAWTPPSLQEVANAIVRHGMTCVTELQNI